MNILGFCLFVLWMLFVIAVGVAFLAWAWKQGEFRIAAIAWGREPRTREPDVVQQGTGIRGKQQVAATKV
jgi:hypothetical protein